MLAVSKMVNVHHADNVHENVTRAMNKNCCVDGPRDVKIAACGKERIASNPRQTPLINSNRSPKRATSHGVAHRTSTSESCPKVISAAGRGKPCLFRNKLP